LEIPIQTASKLLTLVTHRDDAFELIRPNETVLIGVQMLESLTESFSLQALH
jgi:hypothetical protein